MNILLAFPLSMLIHELGHTLVYFILYHRLPKFQLHLSWNRFRLQQGHPDEWSNLPFPLKCYLYGLGPFLGIAVLIQLNHWVWVPLHLLYSWSDMRSIRAAWRARMSE